MTITSSTPRTSHQIGRDFILGGQAIFTMSGTGHRFTYKVNRKEPEPGSRYTQPVYFVALLTGSNNETDYSYLGLLDAATGQVRLTKGSRMTPDAQAVKAITWALPLIFAGKRMPPSFAIVHEGRCARCGRTLTTPESVELGFGPDCAAKLGLGTIITTGAGQPAGPSIFESEL